MSKNILGLDLGTNSIGWAVVEESESGKRIASAGSRIIPMDAKMMGDFESGNTVSQTHDRTQARGMRRLYQRHMLRRERLNRVLDILGYLPEHYKCHLNTYGQINKGEEPKIAWSDTGEFLFMDSFCEMLNEFGEKHPDMLAKNKRIPYDWTVYYLRKKALTQPISGAELAWILHQFNSKRGYNQSRSEQEETNPTEKQEFCSLKVLKVVDTGENSKGKNWYEITLENGWIYRRQSAYPLDWEGKTKDFIVTTKLNEDGSEKLDKEGNVKRTLSAPKDDDWGLRKIKTEHDIAASGMTVGQFVYYALLDNPDQKIIGQLVHTIDRSFYRDEAIRIVEAQKKFHEELNDASLYEAAVLALYQQNEPYRNSISNKDFTYVLVDDVLFYQRPLKSKKSLINECPHEYHWIKDENGNMQKQYLKCISKSHPIYEEFRVWQFVNNLRLFYSSDGFEQQDVTAEKLNRYELAQWLLSVKEVDQKALLKNVFGKAVKGYRWNYVEDKTYPMAPTHALINKALGAETNAEEYMHLWHILYSVTDKKELEQAIAHYAESHELNEEFVKVLSKAKPFPADYGAYSEKATRKLLALMRDGLAWKEDAIDGKSKLRIEKILSGEDDETIDMRVREKCSHLKSIDDFRGLQVWMAEYVVYGVRKHDEKWSCPEDIDTYLHEFRIHSLNNPVVEQVVLETLRTVRDIWKQEGHIDEIHLEMGRELKLPADKRRQILQRQQESEKANEEARKQIIQYIANPSMADIKKYRLWEEQGKVSPYTGEPIPINMLFSSAYEIEHVIPQSRFFDDSMSNKVISEAEVNKLKDRMLGHAFIAAHAGEKVTLTGGRVVTIHTIDAYEDFVKETFKGNKGKIKKMLLDDIPEEFVARQLNDSRYISNLMRGLLSNIVREKNPETGEYEPEATSKNLIVCSGSVTDRLKKDWGIIDVWNRIILPRFVRLNELLQTDAYTRVVNNHLEPSMPLDQREGFNKKRIDHRHHAMDAIVIACATRNHVALLSNENAASSRQQQRIDLSKLLRETSVTEWNGKKHTVFGNFKKPWPTFTQDVEKVLQGIIVSFKQNLRVINKCNNHSLRYVDGKKKMMKQIEGENWAVRKPLHKETVFGFVNLQKKKTATLKYAVEHLNDVVDKELRKVLRLMVAKGFDEKQMKKYFADNKDVWKDINPNKIEVYFYTADTSDNYYASRVSLGEWLDEKSIREKITDSGIQKILLAHLEQYAFDPKEAFSPDGIESMNRNIAVLNGGVPHKPIYKVRKYELAEKFAVGQTGNKTKKYVEAAKGTALFTFVFEKEKESECDRRLVPIALRDVISAQKAAHLNWVEYIKNNLLSINPMLRDYSFMFVLSPGDLVYLPTDEELKTKCYTINIDRIYKVVSLDGENPNFIPVNVASMVVDSVEFTRHNKTSRSTDGKLIKKTCIPIQVDRLGNIIAINND